MPDIITPEERALIDAYPREKVYICARGETAFPVVPCVPPHAIGSMEFSSKMPVRNPRVTEASLAINREILALWKEGLTVAQISEKVKINPKSVYMRRYRMGLSGGI